MNRRAVLAAGVAGGVVSLSGCVSRMTGWSSLTLILRNATEQSVGLQVTIDVNETRAFDRRLTLDANANRDLEASVDVPWDATITYRVTRPDTGGEATRRWEASVPLWGGDECRFEPAVVVESDDIQLNPACR